MVGIDLTVIKRYYSWKFKIKLICIVKWNMVHITTDIHTGLIQICRQNTNHRKSVQKHSNPVINQQQRNKITKRTKIMELTQWKREWDHSLGSLSFEHDFCTSTIKLSVICSKWVNSSNNKKTDRHELYFFFKWHQILIVIPKGTNCVSLFVDLFLYSYEIYFIQGLLKKKKEQNIPIL